MDITLHNIEDTRIKIPGIVRFQNFVIDSPRAKEIDMILRDTNGHLSPHYFYRLMKELRTICRPRTLEVHNLVVLSGRSVLARILGGDTTYTGAINYGLLGTGTTAANAADTTLETEVARKGVARRTRTDARIDFDFYYSQSDTNGTYEEFGTVIDGTSVVDTGQLFNRVLTGGWTKSSTESMTVTARFDVNPG